MRLASFSFRNTSGSPKGLMDLKDAKALLDGLAL
jgi:hypothetical protein